MAYDAPLSLFETEVLPEWIDPNGHLNVTYYVRAFDLSTDAFMDMLGVGWAYSEREKHSIFMLEAHVHSLDEVVEGDRLRFTVQLLDYDAKRIHIFQEMFHAEKGYRAATSEWLAIHVDMAARRSVPLPSGARDKLVEIMAAHQALPRPELAGQAMGIRRKLA